MVRRRRLVPKASAELVPGGASWLWLPPDSRGETWHGLPYLIAICAYTATGYWFKPYTFNEDDSPKAEEPAKPVESAAAEA